jgi:hypothetical protein
MENCEICCDVGEYSNQGKEGTLTFEYSVDGATVKKEKRVKLFYPARTESIPPTPHTGKVHSVNATLEALGQKTAERQHLKFCD